MRNKEYWMNWIRCAGYRALKTFAQTAASLIGVGAVMADIDWLMVGSASLLAAILSLLTSIAGLPEVHLPEPEQPEAEAGEADV